MPLSQSVVGSALRWHRQCVISCGTARDCGHSLYPRSHPPTHPHSLAGEDRGCRCLAPGTPKCQLGGFGTRNLFFNPSPAVTKTKAEPLFLKLTSQGNKIASPPRVHSRRQRAEGRQGSVGRRQPEMILCVPALRRQHDRRGCSMHEVRLIQPISHGCPSEINSNSINILDFAI